MADDKFKKPKKIEYETPDQDPFDPEKTEDTPLSKEFEEQDDTQSTAAIVVEEYGRSIEFMKFVEQLLRDASKVEVEIDPEDDPEVWMAMQRLYGNPTNRLNSLEYFQLVDMLEGVERIEQVDDRNEDGDILDALPNTQEVEEGEITDEDFQISAIDDIEERAKIVRKSVFKDPPPPPPPKSVSWLRRWRKSFRKIEIFGKEYRVQWLRKRWWRK